MTSHPLIRAGGGGGVQYLHAHGEGGTAPSKKRGFGGLGEMETEGVGDRQRGYTLDRWAQKIC